ncbi:MAG TPA: phosphatase PAP2 family protein [Pseudomonadales bacterium]|nr:phosphatase PAP2 family protein [Pseudomonadales bacterium]
MLIKRIAILLLLIIPSLALADKGFLSEKQIQALHIEYLIPMAPTFGSEQDQSDVAIFWGMRDVLKSPRGLQAAQDDVYVPAEVVTRFAPAAGLPKDLPPEQIPHLLNLMEQMQADAEKLVKPVKRKVSAGGKIRPFVRFSGSPTCLEPVDLVKGHKDLDYHYGLKESGSYPSTHALIGILWGALLGDLLPEQRFAVMERGIDFGESRVVCGFHYRSDVASGRVLARALYEKEKTSTAFKKELALARQELKTLGLK